MGAFGVFGVMDRNQLLSVLQKYDIWLGEMGHDPERTKTSSSELPFAAMPQQLGHARWMCQTAIEFIDTGLVIPEDVEKANRWLGFIQGVLWTTGVRTIDEMREDNRAQSPSEVEQSPTS